MSTAAQINANRQNAQHSSGPKTEAGKAASKFNAVKTALTGQTILLPTDDVAAYEKLGETFINLHQPANYEEKLVVQSLIDTEWRLQRVPVLQAGIYVLGRMEFANDYPAEVVEAQTFLKYQSQLKNLSLQETRLLRMKKSDEKRLETLQAQRKEKEEGAKKADQEKPQTAAAAKAEEKTVPASAAALFNEAKPAAATDPSPNASKIGFDFATAQAA